MSIKINTEHSQKLEYLFIHTNKFLKTLLFFILMAFFVFCFPHHKSICRMLKEYDEYSNEIKNYSQEKSHLK